MAPKRFSPISWLRHARQRLSHPGSSRDPGEAFAAPRSTESGIVRTLYDCPDQPLDKSGEPRYRVVIATHPVGATKSRIGVTRDGVGLRTLLDQPAANRFHDCRRGGTLSASNWCVPSAWR
ncbi:hypothetical protein [Reticulibacter mediterranei]|uniref:hypothetical protein n=1 Tax=Reticulibacter mediterranei TaxID=2778369 RepID=UPI001C68FE95|nr:hypothetical protein [Reticulibacter mediterranei]